VLPALGRPVAARGVIKCKPCGQRISVEAESLRALGEQPVSADDVLGVFEGYEVTDWLTGPRSSVHQAVRAG
jgi:hypothetical protein